MHSPEVVILPSTQALQTVLPFLLDLGVGAGTKAAVSVVTSLQCVTVPEDTLKIFTCSEKKTLGKEYEQYRTLPRINAAINKIICGLNKTALSSLYIYVCVITMVKERRYITVIIHGQSRDAACLLRGNKNIKEKVAIIHV